MAAAGLAVLAAVALSPAAAGSPAPLRLSTAAPLRPGAAVVAAWDAPPAGRFDEMEVVLSLDGGRSWPVRISRDLPATASATTFLVPALASEEARLALRAGRKGDRESEEILAESVPFRIGAPPAGAGEALQRVGGEWRTTAAMAGQIPDGPDGTAFGGPPALLGGREDGPEADDDDGGAQVLPVREAEPFLPRRPDSRGRPLLPSASFDRPPFARRE